jgi:heat-inducible transcriptional repressor
MDDRKSFILKKIVEFFIDTAGPIGSKSLLSSTELNVSPATVRNDMAYLESIGMIYQPHTSSGRVPTNKGFRMFVDSLMDTLEEQSFEKEQAMTDYRNLQIQELDMKVRKTVSTMADMTKMVSFATLPWRSESYYLGIANVLRAIEFQSAAKASMIVEVLEDKDRFIQTLSALCIDRKVRAFIGEENALPGIQSCTLLVTIFERGSYRGAIGLLGPTRMRYAYNMKLLEMVRNDLEQL